MTSLLGPQSEFQSKQHTRALQRTSYTTKLGKHGLRENWATGGLRGLWAPCQIFFFSLRITDGRESGEAATPEWGRIPPLMSFSGQQKAEEGGEWVLLRMAWFHLNVRYKKEELWQQGVCGGWGGVDSTISTITVNPEDLNTDTWLDVEWQM